MSKFALKRIEAIDGKQVFQKLVVNDKCQFDEFEESVLTKLNGRYKNEIGVIYQYMEYLSNGSSLPQSHFKDITPTKESVKEYEFRTKHLRVYAIKKKNGKIVVFGGFKKNQKKELKKFRAIKKQYLGIKSLE